MAQAESLVPQTEETPVEQPEVEVQAENTESGSESPTETQQQQPDYEGRFKAYEERLQRAEQRNQYLEQTARLLAEEREQARRQQQQAQQPRNELPPELEDLGKTLDPLIHSRVGRVTQPLVDTLSRVYDEQDSAKFEMYLMRNHPEVFEEEGGLDKVFQEVDAVRRQTAQSYNQWISRVDAYLYAQGIHGVQSQIKSRKEKKGNQVKEEAKRIQSVKAAQSNTTVVAPKRTPNAEIQAIREKTRQGQRLTEAERIKFRDFVSGVSF